MAARGDVNQVVYVDGDVPQLPLQLGQLLVDSSLISPGTTNLQQCTSQNPLVYEPLQGGYPITPEEVAAGVTVSNDLWPPLYLKRYGGGPGTGDNTAAMNAAVAVAAQYGGGEIVMDEVGEWRMNATVAANSIVLVGQGGKAEFNLYCVRPYSISSPALTWGDGTNNYRYCGMSNVAVSGMPTPGSTGYNQAAASASAGVRVRGGMIGLHFVDCWIYNGLRCLSLETSLTAPVTGLRFMRGGARNDIEDSALARTIYGDRKGVGLSDGYFTDNVFEDAKFNGPGGPSATLGYLAEFEGTLGGIIAEFLNCYFDFRTDSVSPTTVCHGVLMKGGNSIRAHALTLDSGSSGAVYIESDQAPYDVGRLLSGMVFANGGGLVKWAGPVYVSLVSESSHYAYLPRLNTPYVTGRVGFTTITDPYDVGNVLPYLDTDTSVGPVTVNRSDWSVKTAGKGLRVAEGSNAKQGTTTLVAGTRVVANTSVTANSRIFLTSQVDGGTPGFLRISARVNGASFTILSSNAADTSTVAWEIFEPA